MKEKMSTLMKEKEGKDVKENKRCKRYKISKFECGLIASCFHLK